MIVTPIHTDKVHARDKPLADFLKDSIEHLEDGSVLAITSKVVSLCEGRVVASDSDREELIKAEAELYYSAETNEYRHHFTITRRTILGASGIDESNGDGYYVLLPNDIQASANSARDYLKVLFGLKNLGVIITDSTSIPFRLGATGACLAYTGFEPINDYRGTKDLFGRPFRLERANVAEGLAGAAVLAMGEGDEQTPLCAITDVTNLRFRDNHPSQAELDSVFLPMSEDLFAPFIDNGRWQKGGRANSHSA